MTCDPRVKRIEPPVPLAGLCQRSIAAMALQAGSRALDVGSGTGTSTLMLADTVGATGLVCGVDYDVTMIIEAERRAIFDGADACVSFHQANAAALPWSDDYFDGSRSDRVLQHMLDPMRAFGELLRVTRTSGRIVVIDGDWATLTLDVDEPANDGRRAYFQDTLRRANPLSGRCLLELFERHGLQDIQIDVIPVFDRTADVDWCWQQSRTPVSERDGRFASANVVMISGRKP